MSEMIQKAEKQLADAVDRVNRLREELAVAEREANGWNDFMVRAKSLGSLNGKAAKPSRESSDTTGITVLGSSLVGKAAVIMRDKGKTTLDDIVAELKASGVDATNPNFRSVVNSALWRRQNDLFRKTKKGYELQTTDFVLR